MTKPPKIKCFIWIAQWENFSSDRKFWNVYVSFHDKLEFVREVGAGSMFEDMTEEDMIDLIENNGWIDPIVIEHPDRLSAPPNGITKLNLYA
jgi:hypothetical protein